MFMTDINWFLFLIVWFFVVMPIIIENSIGKKNMQKNTNDKPDSLAVMAGFFLFLTAVTALIGFWYWAIFGISKEVGQAIGFTAGVFAFVSFLCFVILCAREDIKDTKTNVEINNYGGDVSSNDQRESFRCVFTYKQLIEMNDPDLMNALRQEPGFDESKPLIRRDLIDSNSVVFVQE